MIFQDSETPFHYPNIPNVHSTSCLMLSTHLLKRNSLYKLHLSEFMAKLSSVGIKAFQWGPWNAVGRCGLLFIVIINLVKFELHCAPLESTFCISLVRLKTNARANENELALRARSTVRTGLTVTSFLHFSRVTCNGVWKLSKERPKRRIITCLLEYNTCSVKKPTFFRPRLLLSRWVSE
jgi:hypothetical protein